jgi:hypothetical protein
VQLFSRHLSLLIMRALKLISTILLAAIALTAGLFVAAVVALLGLVAFLGAKLLGRGRLRIALPHVQRRPRAAATSTGSSDAIDVTVTEVANEPVETLPSASGDDARFRA